MWTLKGVMFLSRNLNINECGPEPHACEDVRNLLVSSELSMLRALKAAVGPLMSARGLLLGAGGAGRAGRATGLGQSYS